MRKLAIILGIILWIVAISKLNDTPHDEKDIVSAFGSYESMDNLDTTIEGFTTINRDFKSTKDREDYLAAVADTFQVRGGTIKTKKDGVNITTTYTRPSANGSLTLTLVTLDEPATEAYLFINLNLKDNLSYVFTYQKLLQKICPNNTNILITGEVDGYMDYSEKCILADSFMKRIDANVISENRTDDIFVLYGYTSKIPDFITIQGERINISMSIEYDETKDCTLIHVATPVETFNK